MRLGDFENSLPGRRARSESRAGGMRRAKPRRARAYLCCGRAGLETMCRRGRDRGDQFSCLSLANWGQGYCWLNRAGGVPAACHPRRPHEPYGSVHAAASSHTAFELPDACPTREADRRSEAGGAPRHPRGIRRAAGSSRATGRSLRSRSSSSKSASPVPRCPGVLASPVREPDGARACVATEGHFSGLAFLGCGTPCAVGYGLRVRAAREGNGRHFHRRRGWASGSCRCRCVLRSRRRQWAAMPHRSKPVK
jgi:hypothetical protein